MFSEGFECEETIVEPTSDYLDTTVMDTDFSTIYLESVSENSLADINL